MKINILIMTSDQAGFLFVEHLSVLSWKHEKYDIYITHFLKATHFLSCNLSNAVILTRLTNSITRFIWSFPFIPNRYLESWVARTFKTDRQVQIDVPIFIFSIIIIVFVDVVSSSSLSSPLSSSFHAQHRLSREAVP